MQIHFHPRFKNSYKDLPDKVKLMAEKKETIVRQNPFNPRLKTHKFHGKLKKLWSFSVDARFRIVFEFAGQDVIFLDIGDHDLYR